MSEHHRRATAREHGGARLAIALTLVVVLAFIGGLAWRLRSLDPAAAADSQRASSESELAGSRANRSTVASEARSAPESELGPEVRGVRQSGPERSAFQVPVDPTERPAGNWSAVAVDAADASPIAGARVTLTGMLEPGEQLAVSPASLAGVERSVESGSAGEFELAWFEDAPAFVVVEHPDYLTARFAFDLARADVPLVRAATLAGSLRGAGLAASEGRARVVLWSEGRAADGSRTVLVEDCDAQGKFAFRGLDSGLFGIAAAGQQSVVSLRAGISTELGQTVQLDLDLERGVRAEGRVYVKSSGVSIEAAELVARWLADGLPADVVEHFERRAVTDGAGRYELAGLSPGDTRILVTTPWDSVHARRVAARSSGETVERDIPVGEFAALEGRITDGRGQGISGARLALFLDDPGSDPLAFSELLSEEGQIASAVYVTDSAGAFSLVELPPGRELVLLPLPPGGPDSQGSWGQSAWRPGRARAVRLGIDEERSGLDLSLLPASWLRGLVVDADDPGALPIAEAEVSVEWRSSGVSLAGPPTLTDSEGRFELDAAAGRVHVRIVAEGFAPLSRMVRVNPAQGADERFELERAALVTCFVEDRSGYVVEGARVRMIERDASGKRLRTRTERSDEHGVARFEELPAGLWETSAWAVGFATVSVDPELVELEGFSDDVQIEVELERERARSAVLRGQVVVDRSDSVPVKLQFGGIGSAAVMIDGGRFEISGLRAKQTQLVLKADRCLPKVIAVDLSPGGVVELGIVELGHATQVEVQVLAKGAGPVAKASVTLQKVVPKGTPKKKRPRVVLKEQRRGRYSSSLVPPGKWQLVIERKGKPRHEQEFKVRERARESVRVVLPR